MGKTDRVRSKSDRGAKPAEIGVLIYPGVQVSAVGGLTDLFVTANRLSVERCAADSRTLRITHWKLECSSAQIECIYDTHGGEHEPLVALILPPSLIRRQTEVIVESSKPFGSRVDSGFDPFVNACEQLIGRFEICGFHLAASPHR